MASSVMLFVLMDLHTASILETNLPHEVKRNLIVERISWLCYFLLKIAIILHVTFQNDTVSQPSERLIRWNYTLSFDGALSISRALKWAHDG